MTVRRNATEARAAEIPEATIDSKRRRSSAFHARLVLNLSMAFGPALTLAHVRIKTLKLRLMFHGHCSECLSGLVISRSGEPEAFFDLVH
jgi:hypothetical protein